MCLNRFKRVITGNFLKAIHFSVEMEKRLRDVKTVIVIIADYLTTQLCILGDVKLKPKHIRLSLHANKTLNSGYVEVEITFRH